MRITPLDVRKQEFRKVVRGLDPDEVGAFLSTLADEYEAVLVDNKQLRERILELDEKVSEYRTMERTLRDTLMTAERVLGETKENAAKEASLILKEAEMQAQEVTESFRRQAAELRREIVALHREKEAYLARFRGLAEAQIQFIDNHRTDFEELDRRLMSEADMTAAAHPRRAEDVVLRSADRAVTDPAAAAGGPAGRNSQGRDGNDIWREYQPDVSLAKRRTPASEGSAEPAPAAAGKSGDVGLRSAEVERLLEPIESASRGKPQNPAEQERPQAQEHGELAGDSQRRERPQESGTQMDHRPAADGERPASERPLSGPAPVAMPHDQTGLEPDSGGAEAEGRPLPEDEPVSRSFPDQAETEARKETVPPDDAAEHHPRPSWDMDSFTRGLDQV
jgi:cell division initiation protein